MNKDPLYYEKLGQDFEGFMSDYDVNRRIHLIQKLLGKNRYSSILEIGCGTGRISSVLMKYTDDLTVNDISEKLSQQVSQKLGCHYLSGDCAQLPQDSKHYDLIVSSECIEHTHDPYASLAAITGLLKKDGRLIVTTPNCLWYPVLLIASILRLRKFDGIENWTWPLKTAQWLKSNGFDDIHFSGCHLFPWQIPLVKRALSFFDQFGNGLYLIMINYGFSARKKD